MSVERVWIEKRKGKRGVTYHVRWLDPDTLRKCSESCGRDRRRADHRRIQVHKMLDDGVGPARGRLWAEFVAEEIERAETRVAPKSVKRLRIVLDALTLLCNPASVERITYPMLESFVAKRIAGDHPKLKPCKPVTVHGELGYLDAALRRAKKRGYIASVPEMPDVRVTKRKMRLLTPDEITRIMDGCADARMAAFVWLSLTVGTRADDTASIRWEDVNLTERIVGVFHEKTQTYRTAYLDARGVDLLQMLYDATPKRIKNGGAVPASPWVFVTAEGQRWTARQVYTAWTRMLKRLGIRHARLHDLRDTFASGLANANVNAFLTASLTGHTNIATTNKYYVGVASDAAREAVSRLPWVTPESANCPQVAESDAS